MSSFIRIKEPFCFFCPPSIVYPEPWILSWRPTNAFKMAARFSRGQTKHWNGLLQDSHQNGVTSALYLHYFHRALYFPLRLKDITGVKVARKNKAVGWIWNVGKWIDCQQTKRCSQPFALSAAIGWRDNLVAEHLNNQHTPVGPWLVHKCQLCIKPAVLACCVW